MVDQNALKSLEDLHGLKKDGVITEEDFQKAKENLAKGTSTASSSTAPSSNNATAPTTWQQLWWNPNPPERRPLSQQVREWPSQARSLLNLLEDDTARLMQWIVVSIVLIVGLTVLGDIPHIQLPGASLTLFWTTLGLAVLCVLLMMPPVFYKFDIKFRFAIYALCVIFFIVKSHEHDVTAEAYARTPVGAKEKQIAFQAKVDSIVADINRKSAEQAEDQRSTSNDKAQACLSSGNHFPALEEAVKNSLHNPDSFQFIDTTIATVRENEASLFMGFRGENGFGAIRSGTVRATINTDDCSITNIEEPKVD